MNPLTLTCINNGAKEGGTVVDVPKLQGMMKEKGILIDGGYGKLKGKAFRLSNMGDETEETMGDLFAKLDTSMAVLWTKARPKVFRRYIRPPSARPAPCRV